MSSITFNGTIVDYGSSTTDLVVNSTTGNVSLGSGQRYYRNVTINYGYTLTIARDADFRVNTLLSNSGRITASGGGEIGRAHV